ncbi:MAG: hypothetical protein JJ866_09620 [Roseibium sp.]|uniref:hypothetical protein n=1 Tax=Roseibium sp. TaxID=1936156 RepID=UPI001B28AB9F|nr:hypothetical protein [Roseibium sp.]MBO6892187.1 hypothetical protein [Roseibium sp.]MBO6931022.1 hypothetical protein [Roseibium sp.]
MSDTTSTSEERQGPRIETLIIAAICFLAVLAAWWLLSGRQQSLRASPAGLDGLQVWLSSNGVSAQNFSGGWLMDQNSVGLLVLPLYDTRLDEDRIAPANKEELLQQQDEFDLESAQIFEKASKVPTMLVLPKWRTGMRLTSRVHSVLLVEQDRLSAILGKLLEGGDYEVSRDSEPFTEFSYTSSDGDTRWMEIYSAQTFKGGNCTPIIGTQDDMLLAECHMDRSQADGDPTVLVLADPDLLNNHGLRLGDNATVALDVLRTRAGDHNLVIDYTQSVWLRDPANQPKRERTWSDLLRFFEQPFLTLWISAGLILALALWRAALRYGPIRSGLSGPGASKSLAIRARARLMRLSGQDGALASEYASARIAAKAEALFGAAHARYYSSEDEFLKYADRRHPDEAERLRAILNEIRMLPVYLPASEAIHQIDELEQVLEQITHDA